MKNVIILDNKPYIRYRVKEILEKRDILVHEAASSSQLSVKLNELQNQVDLLIVEINLKGEDGIEIIKKLRKNKINVPFMVLTSLNTRDSFIRAVKVGAIDYFIKPFDDKAFLDRVTRHASGDNSIEPQRDRALPIKEISFKDYLQEEIEKAKAGKYSISIVMSIFFKSLTDVTLDIENDNMIVTDYIFGKVKAVASDAARFSKYGSRTFIAAYPLCDEEEAQSVCDKMKMNFEEIKVKDNLIKDYYFDNIHITFPKENGNSEEILDKLTEVMRLKIKEKQGGLDL